MKLFIPPLKTELKLTSGWTFKLHHESRNVTLFEMLGLDYTDPWAWRREAPNYERWGHLPPPVDATLPRGTVLIVDRIYIRQGGEEFDSITFRIKSMPGNNKPQKAMPGKKTKTSARFWAKLDDCNGINVQVLEKEGKSS